MKRKLALAMAGVTIAGALVIPRAFALNENGQEGQTPAPPITTTQQADLQVQPQDSQADVQVQPVQLQDRQGDGQENFYDQMYDWHKEWLDEARKSGQVSPEEAKNWEEHFTYMRDFHKINGPGMMNGGMMNGSVMGGGMMGNYGNRGMMGGYGQLNR